VTEYRPYNPNTDGNLDDWAANMAYPAEQAMLARAEQAPGEVTPDVHITQEEMTAAYMEDDMTIDRYRINDALTNLANEFESELDDNTLNELTHHVANVIEAGTCGEHAGSGWPCPTCDICGRSSCFTVETMEWNGETGNHVECEKATKP
jgi:hypothetical protein